MKRRIALLLTIVLIAAVGALLLTGCSWSIFDLFRGKKYEGFYYRVVDGQVTITDYSCENQHVVIPETIEGMPVVEIETRVFFMDDDIVSITFPDSNIVVEWENLCYCASLQTVVLGENTQIGSDIIGFDCESFVYNQYGNGLYVGTATNPYHMLVLPVNQQIQDISIHTDTKVVGYAALIRCKELVTVDFPVGVTTIGNSVTRSCEKLEYMSIPASVTSIGYGLFSGCHALSNVELSPENEHYKLEGNALYTKDGTTLVEYYTPQQSTIFTAPNSVKEIADFAFVDIKNLEGVVLPDNVETLGLAVFSGCHDLKKVTLGKNIKIIEEWTFEECRSLVEVEMPSVEEIRQLAFSRCESLQHVGWSDNLRVIELQTFFVCPSLTEVVIPDGVTSLGVQVFYKCTSLKTVVLGSGLRYIGETAFTECPALESVTFVDPTGWRVHTGWFSSSKKDMSDPQANAEFFRTYNGYYSGSWLTKKKTVFTIN